MLLLGIGAGMAFNPVLLAAMGDVAPEEAGLASGMVNTSFMMGGALGLAVLASLAAWRSDELLASGESTAAALTGGYHAAFLLGALFAALGAVAAATLLRPVPTEAAAHGEPAPRRRISLFACRTRRTRPTGRGSTSRMTAGQGRRSCSTAASSTRWSSSGASRFRSRCRSSADEFRLIYADHRGLGRSDKPHDTASYAMPLQAADAVAVLDELGVERAHFAGASYGGRLCFGIGEHAADRVLSLVAGGQQPYAIDPEGPLARVVSGVLDKTRREGAVAFVEALEEYWEARFPDDFRPVYLAQDGAALAAAAEAMLDAGRHLRRPVGLARSMPHLSRRRGRRLLRAGPASGRRDPERRVHRPRRGSTTTARTSCPNASFRPCCARSAVRQAGALGMSALRVVCQAESMRSPCVVTSSSPHSDEFDD